MNTWTDEEWGFARENRLFSVPMISLSNLELALQELDFVMKCGARMVGIRPAPVPDIRGARSFGFPEFDPFWAKLAEAKMFVCMHASDSGYDAISRLWAGDDSSEYVAFKNSDPHKLTMDGLGRPIADALSALICHGVFDRHPDLRVISVENGSAWVGPLLHRLAHAYGQMPQGFKRHPVETFHRNIFVAPFYEDDPIKLAELIPIERILFGSDFPHPEGLAEPLDYLHEFRNFKADDIEKIFSTNLKGLIEGARN